MDESIYRGYFQVFADLYKHRLDDAVAQGELAPGDSEVRAWCLIGISNFLGMQYALWEKPASMDKVVAAAHDLITHGLAAR